MKTTIEHNPKLGRSTSGRAGAIPWLAAASTLELALIYEDTRTQNWTRGVTELLALSCGAEAVHSDGWQISELSRNRSLAEAVDAASHADVIVVSLYAAEQSPPEFYVWIDAWLPRRLQIKGALVGLIGVSATAEAYRDRAESYLRAVARKGELDCFIRPIELAVENNIVSLAALAANTSSITSVESYEHWGLNE